MSDFKNAFEVIRCWLLSPLPGAMEQYCQREAPVLQAPPIKHEEPFYDEPIGPELPPSVPKPKANRPPVYKPPVLPSPEIPDRKFPREADGQTDYDTPNGKSISLQTALKNREYGRLLWNPLSDEKIEVKKSDYGDLENRIKNKLEEGTDRFSAYLEGKNKLDQNVFDKIAQFFGQGTDPNVTLWDKTALVFPEHIEGFSGNVQLTFGLRVLGEIAGVYRNESQNALMKVHDFIPKKIKTKKNNPKIENNYNNNQENVDIMSFGRMEQVLAPDQFPGELPHLLNIERKDEKPEDRKVKNYPELFLWFIKEFDSIFGEFPISIEIEDADLVEEGNQSKTLKIANLAEGISELFGLAFNGATIHDANLNILLRFIPEILRIRQLSVTTQDICIANREFLGYREKEVTKEIESQFALLKDFDNLSKLLQPETQKYKSVEFDGKETLMDFLLRLQFVAALQKALLVKNTKEIQEFVDNNGNDTNLDEWNEFLRIINDPASQFNFGEKPSKVRDTEGQ